MCSPYPSAGRGGHGYDRDHHHLPGEHRDGQTPNPDALLTFRDQMNSSCSSPLPISSHAGYG
jgi:hypothetical protein